MLSYIVGLLAIVIFLGNPILELIAPDRGAAKSLRRGPLSPRPQLNESLLAIDGVNDTAPECPPDAYVARILRRQPLVVYFENFLSEDERRHLLEISEPLFEPSTVTHDSQTTQRDTAVRDSEVAVIPRTNDVRCIERRAMAAQGWRRDVWIERLRTQRYVAPAGHYSHHFDWNLAHRGGWGRVSSFMVWVDDGTLSGVAQSQGFEGGGTEFPRLEWRGEEQLCAFVECSEGGGKAEGGDESETKGLTFRVKPGNAVYWENFSPYDGHGYEETWHAGLPVTKGTKVGLNIWSYGRIE